MAAVHKVIGLSALGIQIDTTVRQTNAFPLLFAL